MATNIPIVLEGSTLGERHRFYNAIVNNAFQNKVDIQSVLDDDEKSPIDRLYKIDLASKHRDVEYMLHNLKDDDMLYVSRVLKSRWLLEPRYRDIINPRHLEDEIFPHMIQPAVNKTRHWLYKNLTDNARCQEFYEYYRDRNDIAIKFLWHCTPDYILSEINNVINKLSPHDLKVLCESCPRAALAYFEGLRDNKEALVRNHKNEQAYFKSIQCVRKIDPELYLDITEKHFRLRKFAPMGPEATRYIMKNHKHRFNAKPELYAGYVLHENTLASFLNSEEAKELVLKLARAEDIILHNVLNKAKPILKRVDVKERAAFTQQVFFEKAYGDKLKQWPYPVPVPPKVERKTGYSIFDDKRYELTDYNDFDCYLKVHSKCCEYYNTEKSSEILEIILQHMQSLNKTSPLDKLLDKYRFKGLDKLFDKYRFKGFEETYQDVCEKLRAEGSVEGRMFMFLYLASKSGGVPEQVAKLLTLLVTTHMNEPSNLRGAVVAFLVKHAAAWRLPDDTWNMMIKFGHDLGLEGNEDNLQFTEGLHGVVLRHLLKNEPIPDDVKRTFLTETSTFKEYKLNSEEKQLVGPKLAEILLSENPEDFINVLADYKLNVKNIPDAELTLAEKARSDKEVLGRLYKNKIARRYLLKEIFANVSKEVSFINALRHDTSVLQNGDSFALLAKKKRPNHDRFLTSLSLYFNEPRGLAEQHRAKLIQVMKTYPQPWFARLINILATNVPLPDLLLEVDVIKKKDYNKALAAAFKATTHKSRPFLYIKGVDTDWLEWLGAKAVANKVLVCREEDRESYIKLLLQWRRTARMALRLGLDSKSSTETFIAVSKLHPTVALKVANKTYLRNETIDPQIWEVTKQLLMNVVSKKSSRYLCDQLRNNKNVPKNIETEYWETLYMVFLKVDKEMTLPILCRMENMQTTVNQDLIKRVLQTFIYEELVSDYFTHDDDDIGKRSKQLQCLYVSVLAKYLLTSTSEKEQEERLKHTCDVFFQKIGILTKTMKDNNQLRSLYNMLKNFVLALKYNKAFLGDYTPCYVVFERVLDNMKRVLPKEKYLTLYIETHLIMVYYKSIRESVEKNPEIFDNLEQNVEVATEIVGLQMGRNIGKDITDFTSKYYFSVIDIYKKVLVEYLDDFKYYYGENPVLSPVVRGLLEVGHTQSLLLAQHVLKKRDFYLLETARVNLEKGLQSFGSKIVNFFLHFK